MGKIEKLGGGRLPTTSLVTCLGFNRFCTQLPLSSIQCSHMHEQHSNFVCDDRGI